MAYWNMTRFGFVFIAMAMLMVSMSNAAEEQESVTNIKAQRSAVKAWAETLHEEDYDAITGLKHMETNQLTFLNTTHQDCRIFLRIMELRLTSHWLVPVTVRMIALFVIATYRTNTGVEYLSSLFLSISKI